MMGRRQKIKSGAEYDALYGRGIYCYLSRAGVLRFIKRGMWRRERRAAKMDCKKYT